MFIGHYAVGFASKKFAPKTSLGWLVLAPLWLDILWPFFLLAGLERATILPDSDRVMPIDLDHYPFSHSLVASLGWAVLLGGIYYFLRRDKRGSVVIGVGVVSHWVLDWVTHRPDMPIAFGSIEKYGLALWDYPVAAFLIEATLFVLCCWIYLQTTTASNKIGKYGIWIYFVVLMTLFCGQFSGLKPPDIEALAMSAFFLFPLIPIAHWIDKNRVSRV